jgi:CheY-like chemotaxis protein
VSEKRLLVVDDEPEFGEFVRKVAVGLGYEVEVTGDGKSFMTAYESFDPSVIILDLVMPGIDGVELVQWLVEHNFTAQLIVITGYNPKYAALAGKLAEARGLSSVTTLTKPVKLSRLRNTLAPWR